MTFPMIEAVKYNRLRKRVERLEDNREAVKKAWLENFNETDSAIVLIDIGKALFGTRENDTVELRKILEAEN